ncbi:lytic murein transglycosylase [Actinomycetes bacterium KLBMP 9759]
MSLRNPPPVRRSPVVGILVGVVAFFAVIVVVAVVADSLLRSSGGRGDDDPRSNDGLVPADVDRGTPVPQPPALGPATNVAAWAAEMSARTTIPQRALQAYGAAEIAQRKARPSCRLSWATLAGIGRIESDHGRLGAADLDADGGVRPKIIGIPLDGSYNTREILDTDQGRVDGDTTYDRAVGPMQFLPTTWRRYAADGNGDGVRDPHQIDDAARGAAAYLCAGGRNTASGEGWWDGVLTYNQSNEYARLVWAAADRYAAA